MTALLMSLALVATLTPPAGRADESPHILLILVDDKSERMRPDKDPVISRDTQFPWAIFDPWKVGQIRVD